MSNADKSSFPSAPNPSFLAGRNWFERLLENFIAKRTPNCREVVRLLSQSLEVKLPVTTWIKIRFHYLICIWCYRYGKQLQALRRIFLFVTRARGRLLSRDITIFIKKTDKTSATRNASMSDCLTRSANERRGRFEQKLALLSLLQDYQLGPRRLPQAWGILPTSSDPGIRQ
jgi:hypothetical protein